MSGLSLNIQFPETSPVTIFKSIPVQSFAVITVSSFSLNENFYDTDPPFDTYRFSFWGKLINSITSF